MKKCPSNTIYGTNAAQDSVQRGPPSRRKFVELTEYCEQKYHRIDSSIINLMSYISTGIFVWCLLRGICFGISFSSIEGVRIKEILNVAMYTAPYFLQPDIHRYCDNYLGDDTSGAVTFANVADHKDRRKRAGLYTPLQIIKVFSSLG
uniref:Uncharacterized protein n=1 Tax=Pectobacterium carotovorum TaxID=554 RepID=A0A0N9NMK2_PECCA|nr:hypothetical protein [Pectobacterium carotovorum]ALG88466.1 Hypothetical protein [Pectobacterium carotovorum]